jgi:hypothetical protein
MPNVLREWPTRARLLLLSLLIASASACGNEIPPPSEPPPDPVCPGTRAARANLADTLARTPDMVLATEWGKAVVTHGAAMVDLVDARCRE